MRTHSTTKPVGNDAETTFHSRQHERAQAELQFYDSMTVRVEQTTRGIRFHAKIPPPGSGTKGWFWTKGSRNYDHTKSFKESQLVYVQPTDTMVSAGTTDPDSMATVKAIAGIWVALQDVAPTVISGTTYYHIPHLPLPTPGDMEAANNYWAFVSQDAVCI